MKCENLPVNLPLSLPTTLPTLAWTKPRNPPPPFTSEVPMILLREPTPCVTKSLDTEVDKIRNRETTLPEHFNSRPAEGRRRNNSSTVRWHPIARRVESNPSRKNKGGRRAREHLSDEKRHDHYPPTTERLARIGTHSLSTFAPRYPRYPLGTAPSKTLSPNSCITPNSTE